MRQDVTGYTDEIASRGITFTNFFPNLARQISCVGTGAIIKTVIAKSSHHVRDAIGAGTAPPKRPATVLAAMVELGTH